MSAPQAKFVWYDLMTTDTAAAAEFYASVVGWTAQKMDLPTQPYTLLFTGNTPVAGIMPIPPDALANTGQPCWNGYIGVDDVDAYAQQVTAAGGSITRPPSDIPGIGRFAVAAGPDGAHFLLFKPNQPDGPPFDTNELGRIGWNELHSNHWERAWEFYSTLFGWTKETAVDMGPMGVYQTFETGATPGGMMNRMPQSPGPFWLYYFNVDSVTAAIERIQHAGGSLTAGPHEVPGGAWIVQGLDPQGALFALTSRTR